MSEEIKITAQNKDEKYQELIPQIQNLIQGESDMIANMANVCAALKQTFGFLWIGFYLVKDDELVLGPFQGPVACTRIQKGKGVCGTAWANEETIIVPDVDKFPGHIACSSLSKSEIVFPMFDKDQKVIGVLDVDSDTYNDFDHSDAMYLGHIVSLLKG